MSANCVLVAGTVANQAAAFKITDTKFYVLVMTLLVQDNANLLEQLKSGFIIKINWNKYPSKTATPAQNQYIDYLIDLSFQGVNKILINKICFMIWKYWTSKKLELIFYSKHRNKRLQCYDP